MSTVPPVATWKLPTPFLSFRRNTPGTGPLSLCMHQAQGPNSIPRPLQKSLLKQQTVLNAAPSTTPDNRRPVCWTSATHCTLKASFSATTHLHVPPPPQTISSSRGEHPHMEPACSNACQVANEACPWIECRCQQQLRPRHVLQTATANTAHSLGRLTCLVPSIDQS